MPNKRKNKPKQKRTMKSKPSTSFGPVTAISSAPVAIGNSIKGTKPIVSMTVDGARVIGRDFAFAAAFTPAAVAGWTLVGGMPITPSVLASSALKSYCQMYAKFKVNAIAFHFITSSATSQTGDVMFYVERDRQGPFIDCTSNSFLPFTLSDPNTVLGPQWTNHTAVYKPTTGFKYTNYGVNVDLNEESPGQVTLFSKTSTASSPGYVLIDYDITFKELQVNPRAGVLPMSRGQFTPVCFARSAISVTIGTTAIEADIDLGKSITGSTSAPPAGTIAGDIFRCIADVTNSTLVNPTWIGADPGSLIRYEMPGGGDFAVTIDDGFTFYAVAITSTRFRFFTTLAAALSGSLSLSYGVTNAALTYALCCQISLVSQTNSQAQASY